MSIGVSGTQPQAGVLAPEGDRDGSGRRFLRRRGPGTVKIPERADVYIRICFPGAWEADSGADP
jgi:hypothetical protein